MVQIFISECQISFFSFTTYLFFFLRSDKMSHNEFIMPLPHKVCRTFRKKKKKNASLRSSGRVLISAVLFTFKILSF